MWALQIGVLFHACPASAFLTELSSLILYFSLLKKIIDNCSVQLWASVSYSYCNKVSQASLVSWRIQFYYVMIPEVSQHDPAPLKQKCWQGCTLSGHSTEGFCFLAFSDSTFYAYSLEHSPVPTANPADTGPGISWFTLLFCFQYHISLADF